MNFALCHLSVVPFRSSPSDKSEQTSQVLFGEIVELMEWKGKSWVKARCTWDNSIGWIKATQIKPITSAEYDLFEHRFAYCLDLFQPIMCGDYSMPITLGARLPDFDGMKFIFDSVTYSYSGQAVFPENLEATAEKVIKIARRYLMAPYQWGGRSPLGIDSAGFTQMVFKLVGIKLHRLAEQQVHQGHLVDFVEQSLPGDLAFFENHLGNIAHVGILLPEGRIIHAAEQVRIDRIDHYGIFSEAQQRYSHRLRVVKRLLAPAKMEKISAQEEKLAGNQVALFG
ncbi:MAG: C40 family peptidase [Saprospiraceae bacterium]|nr:C40 family peptidase [Saprospiraceae bacterium]